MNDAASWKATIADLEAKLATEGQRECKLLVKKKALALKAHVEGGQASKMLASYNKEVLESRAAIEDLEVAIAEAEVHLAEARRAGERAQEAERMRVLGELSEARIESAGKIDGAMRELGALLDHHDRLAREMLLMRPHDDGHRRRVLAEPRVLTAMQSAIGLHLGMAERSVDPRSGKTLRELEEAALSCFALTDAGIEPATAVPEPVAEPAEAA
jgi:hypothetical protein